MSYLVVAQGDSGIFTPAHGDGRVPPQQQSPGGAMQVRRAPAP